MVPANLSQPCPQIKELSDGTGGTILKWGNGLILDYAHCSDNQRSLLDLITDYNERLLANVS